MNACEARGEMSTSDRGIITEDDKISLILQHCSKMPPYKNGVFFSHAYQDQVNVDKKLKILENITHIYSDRLPYL